MNYDEMSAAVKDAERTMRLADIATDSLVQLVVGRLRKVTSWRGHDALKSLKKELRDYNMGTGKWKQ